MSEAGRLRVTSAMSELSEKRLKKIIIKKKKKKEKKEREKKIKKEEKKNLNKKVVLCCKWFGITNNLVLQIKLDS